MALSCATKASVPWPTENVEDFAQLWVNAETGGCPKSEDQKTSSERVSVSQFVCPRLSNVPVGSPSAACVSLPWGAGHWNHADDAHVQLYNLTLLFVV